jgi:hypothetical protein
VIKEHLTTEAQRNELLHNLRYTEMRQQYNDVLDSSEASFDRVFASYKRITNNDNDSQISKDDSGHSSTNTRHENEDDSQLSGGYHGESEENEMIGRAWFNFLEWLRLSHSWIGKEYCDEIYP